MNQTHSVADISFSKASPLPTGRQAAHAQICPLYKKVRRSALRRPFVRRSALRDPLVTIQIKLKKDVLPQFQLCFIHLIHNKRLRCYSFLITLVIINNTSHVTYVISSCHLDVISQDSLNFMRMVTEMRFHDKNLSNLVSLTSDIQGKW